MRDDRWFDRDAVSVLEVATGQILRVLDDVAEFPEFSQIVWSDGRLYATNTDAVVMWSP